MKVASPIISVVIVLLIAGLGVLTGWRAHPDYPEIRIDTIVRVDTMRDTVRLPVTRYITRVDTVWMVVADPTAANKDSIRVTVPIERKVYQTDDYRAEIEGFRPSLVSMEVYRRTQFVTQTQTVKVPDPRRWGFGLQAGYGATIQNGRIVGVPYIGVGVQYSIFKW